ncbi:hypothetical protein BK816_00690 [Boudabousia tangfeifanii]|uniref:Phosphotyrosine protein phosphatase I domain-containing protein n=1 Tax=Boudabousia tangfeifanii TaxID=1912795 RepID=A0A1D9MIF8_9ACTO|nr:hypothetical protein [Boudabousia tangfeifanii]AOZ71993.1 hypothetical protein BK816_00690 [Boudabousia tangfeifanii]
MTSNDNEKTAILFVSRGGGIASCAALLARHAAHLKEIEAFAAYTNTQMQEPDELLEQVMSEDGLDLATIVPLALGKDLLDYCQVVVTLGGVKAEDVGEHPKVLHWDLPSTDGQDIVTIRKIFEDLRWKVKELVDGI